MTIKSAILQYLKSAYVSERDILTHLIMLGVTKSKTPERSINRTLNELANANILAKTYRIDKNGKRVKGTNRYALLKDIPLPPSDTWYKKVYKSVIYCDGKKGKENKKSVYAYTFEQNQIDRTIPLHDAIVEIYGRCYDVNTGDYVKASHTDYGYMITQVTTQEVEWNYIYDNIHVGED